MDSNTGGTMSAQTYQFDTAWPQPPSSFYLFNPVDGATLNGDYGYVATLNWGKSTDPDPGESESIRYEFSGHVHDGNGLDTTVVWDFGSVQEVDVSVPDSLGLVNWDFLIFIDWTIFAVSGDDRTMAREERCFKIAPNSTSAEDKENVLPSSYQFHVPYPNPFNAYTTVVVELPEEARVRIEIFNTLGQRVQLLHDGRLKAGIHKLTLSGKELSSGIYFVRAMVPGKLGKIHKVVLMK